MADDQTSLTLSDDAKSDLQRFKSDDETWNECIQRITQVLSRVIREADEDIVGEAATEAEALDLVLQAFDGDIFAQMGVDSTPEVRLSDEEFERMSDHVQQTVRNTIHELR